MQENSRRFALQERSAGKIVGDSFRIYFSRFSKYSVFTLAIYFVFLLIYGCLMTQQLIQILSFLHYDELLAVLATRNASMIENFVMYYFGTEQAVMQALLGVLPAVFAFSGIAAGFGLLNSILVEPLVYGGIANVTMGTLHGVEDTAGGWLKRTFHFYGKLIRTGLAILVCSLAFGLAIALCLLLLMGITALLIGGGSIGGSMIGLIIAMAGYLAVIFAALVYSAWIYQIYPVCAGEAKFGFEAVGRAFTLLKKKFWKCLGVTVLMLLIIEGISMVISLVFSFGGNSLSGMWITSIGSALVGALVTPLMLIAETLLNADIRYTEENYGREEPEVSSENASSFIPTEISGTESVVDEPQTLPSEERSDPLSPAEESYSEISEEADVTEDTLSMDDPEENPMPAEKPEEEEAENISENSEEDSE